MRSLHTLLTATAPIAASSLLVAACSGGNNNGGSGPHDAASDVPMDVMHIQPQDSGEGGMSVPPSGTHVYETTDPLQLYGVTSDGYAIFADTMTSNISAVSVASANGTPQMVLANAGANASVIVNGPVVEIWANVDANFIGPLTVWTSAKGPQMLSTASLAASYVSKDQTHVAFFDNSTATTTALAVAGVDGTGKATVVPMATVSTACQPVMGWAANDLLAAYCGGAAAPPGDAGTEAGSADGGASDAGASGTGTKITRFTGTGWMPMPITTTATATAIEANSTADHVLFFDSGGLEAYDIATGMTAPIDKDGDSFVITPDGTKVVYGTLVTPDAGADAGAMIGPYKVSPIAAPSPTTLGTGIFAFTSISPDGNWVLAFNQQDMTGAYSNVLLASASTAGTPQVLNMQATSSPIGDSFTGDSKFAIYTDTITMTMTSSGNVTSGNLNVVATSGSAMPMQLGMAVWQDAAGPASKVIFNPNWTAPTNTGFGTADLTEIDMSQATPSAQVLVTAADANFFLTSDKMNIVYTYSNGGSSRPTAQSGLWAMPTP
jgi:hypothetical protein